MKKTEPKVQRYYLAFISYQNKHLWQREIYSCATVLDRKNCYDIIQTYKSSFGKFDYGKYIFSIPQIVLKDYLAFPGRIHMQGTLDMIDGVFIVIPQTDPAARYYMLLKIQKEIINNNSAKV